MSNKLSSKLLLECAQGNFKLVNSIIISETLELDDITAATIIIECCRIFCKEDEPTVEEKDLYELLITCKQFIKKLNDDNICLGYLQSLCFIVKFFLMQKKFERLLGMKDLLLPKFINCLKNAKLVKVYSHICNLIHHSVVDLQHVEASDKNGEVFCQLCTLLLQMKVAHLSTNILLANAAYSFFKCPIFLKAGIDSQYKCYMDVLQILKTSKETVANGNLNDFYCAILKILDIVITNLFKQKEFSKIREFIKIITLTVDKAYSKLFDMLYHCSQIVVKLEDIQHSKLLQSNFKTCLKDLKMFSHNYSFTSEFEILLFNLLYLIYFNILEYYTSVNPAIWNTFMEEQIQIVIYKLLGNTGQIVSQIKSKCQVCPNCGVQDNLYSAHTITALAGNLLQISLDKQEIVSKSVYRYVLHYLESCCIFIKMLSSQKCLQWKSAWSRVGVMIYNIAAKLYTLKCDESCNYFLLFIKNQIHLEGIEKSSVFRKDVLGISFQCLTIMNINNCHFKKALLYAAVGILVARDPIDAYRMWATAKGKSKDSGITEECDLQQLTVVCVLEQNKEEINNLYPELNLELNAATTRNLLIGELSQYKLLWPSKIPMLAAFRKLYHVTDLLTSVEVIIEIWWENLSSVHNDIMKLLDEITLKFELECEKDTTNKESYEKTEKQLCLAFLYVMQYYTQTNIARQNIADEIKNTVIPEQLPLLPHEEVKNPNDECDLASSHTTLTLDEHMKVITLLSKALNLINTYISDFPLPIIIERLEQRDLFNVVVKIAHEFRLHCDSVQAIQSWFLCLKISRLLHNSMYILQSISFLLEETNMDSKIISELIIEAEKLEKDIGKLASPEIWEVLTTYHINKSRMLLRYQNVQTGYKEYEQASKCFLKLQEDQNELLKIRLDFLHVQYLRLSCDLQVEGHNVFSLVKCSKLLNRITNYLKVSDTSFAIAIYFELYEAVAHMYRWMHLPREVRCYCREVVTYAQQLVVPLQTAYFLIHLAHADLLSARLDDCQVKLNGLSDLLCLDSKRSMPSYTELSEGIVTVKKEVDISNLVEDFAEMMLDYPSTYSTYNKSSSSPVLLVKSFKLPSFMKHSPDCNCFYCLRVEYKTLVLEYINLQAQLHIFQNNIAAAQACFNAGLQLYQNIKKDDSFKTKLTKQLGCYPLPEWNDILCQTVCALLINYVNSLLRINDLKKAELFNQKILNLLSKRKYENLYMYNESLLQKSLIINICENKSQNTTNYLQVKTQLLNMKDINEIPKTPENKQTKVVISTCHSPRPNIPPKRRLRKMKCDFSDNSDNLKTDKPSLSDVCATKENIENVKFDLAEETESIENLKDPVKISCKTPAYVYVPAPKVLLPTPLPKNPALNDTNISNDQNISGVIPESPNAYTPNSLHASSALQNRTKLLTKRLKKSTVKKCAINNADNNADEGAKSKSKCKFDNNVCKNLMNELCATESNINVKPVCKKKTRNCFSDTTKEQSNTCRTTRATSKLNK